MNVYTVLCTFGGLCLRCELSDVWHCDTSEADCCSVMSWEMASHSSALWWPDCNRRRAIFDENWQYMSIRLGQRKERAAELAERVLSRRVGRRARRSVPCFLRQLSPWIFYLFPCRCSRHDKYSLSSSLFFGKNSAEVSYVQEGFMFVIRRYFICTLSVLLRKKRVYNYYKCSLYAF